jgi:hypothetical protein
LLSTSSEAGLPTTRLSRTSITSSCGWRPFGKPWSPLKLYLSVSGSATEARTSTFGRGVAKARSVARASSAKVRGSFRGRPRLNASFIEEGMNTVFTAGLPMRSNCS